MKNKETLEEAAIKYAEANKFGSDRPFEFNRYKHAYKQGAKWQEQNSDKKYSEDEVIDLLKCLQIEYLINKERINIDKWFKQFKNK